MEGGWRVIRMEKTMGRRSRTMTRKKARARARVRARRRRRGYSRSTRTRRRNSGSSNERESSSEHSPDAFAHLTDAFAHTGHRISTTGTSEYKLNNKVVTYSAYNAALIQHNILVKAKNFLVFQGDVEAVASQSPKELSRLIDQISGSLELAPDYEKAKEALERATENATFNFTKRRGIAGEIKQYKEQKGEAERFEQLCDERVCSFCLCSH